MSGDDAMRDLAGSLPVPEFADLAFTTPPPLADATVAIVTSAALHVAGGDPFEPNDAGYRRLDRTERNLVLGHWSPNFDRIGFALDLNVVYPIDRLEELAANGTIGAVADAHYSFAGNQPDDVSALRLDSGPAVAQQMLDDDVDVVVLTPV